MIKPMETTDAHEQNEDLLVTGISLPVDKDSGELDFEVLAVQTADQAWQICSNLEQDNKTRATRMAEIQKIYDGHPPYSMANKAANAADWQSNFSTRLLAGICDRRIQRFVQSFNRKTYLTRSALTSGIPDYKVKSELFQQETTRSLRSLPDWKDSINSLSTLVTLHGYCFNLMLDESGFTPTIYSPDKVFLSEGAKQHAKDQDVICIAEDVKVSDLAVKLKNSKVAKDLGWDLGNCAKVIKGAAPQDKLADSTTTDPNAINEVIRNGALSATYGGATAGGPKVVRVFHLLVKEYDGTVSLWTVGRNGKEKLRHLSKMWKKMEDVFTPYTFQTGNLSIHGSQGIGRMLAPLALAIEKGRNQQFDQLFMSGLLLMTNKDGAAKGNPVISYPFGLLPQGVEVLKERFESDTKSLFDLETTLVNAAEQATGAYVGQEIQSGSTQQTATASRITAVLNNESAEALEARLMLQLEGMIGCLQRRMFNDDNLDLALELIDAEVSQKKTPVEIEGEIDDMGEDGIAIRAAINLMKGGVSIDEIKLLRNKPTIANVDEVTSSAAVLELVSRLKGDPRINQDELLRDEVLAVAGPDAVEKYVLPAQGATTTTAEAQRAQILELTAMATAIEMGFPADIPVSERDNHQIHLPAAIGAADALLAQAQQNGVEENKLQLYGAIINHVGLHLQAMQNMQLEKDPAFVQASAWYGNAKSQLQQFLAQKAEAEETDKLAEAAIAGADEAANMGVKGGAVQGVQAVLAATEGQAPVEAPVQ